MNDYKISIVVSQFNQEISDELLSGALKEYEKNVGNIENVKIIKVPGAFEIPGTVKQILKKDKVDAVLTLGSVIKGETAHFEYISSSVTDSLSKLSIETDIPVIYGILTAYSYSQAIERAKRNKLNKGGEVMKAALETINVYKNINH